MRIEIAQEKHARQIADIYAPFVRSTAVSLETDAPDAAELASQMQRIMQRYPFLVCRDGKRITAFACAEQLSKSGGFDLSVTSRIYVHQGYQRKGIGEALYTALLGMLKAQGLVNVYATVAMPNLASCALHEKLGFEKEVLIKNAAYKLGRWHDVMCYRIILNDGIPQQPRSFADLTESEIAEAIKEGEFMLCK